LFAVPKPLILNLREESRRQAGTEPVSSREEQERLVSRFSSQVMAVNGFFKSVPDVERASNYVKNLALARKAKRVVLTDDPLALELFDKLAGEASLDVASGSTRSRENFFESIRNAQIGVSSVNLAVAETGTLIVSTSDELNRLVTALPEVHVAMVPSSKLVFSLEDAGGYLSEATTKANGPVTVSLISSSSRTSDIGRMVILGVHGPKELHVLLLG